MSTTPVPKTSRKAPVAVTILGAVCLVGAVVAAVIAVRLFMSVIPLGVVAADGSPGSKAVGGVEVPGQVALRLDADTTYAVYLARPAAADDVDLMGPVTLVGPDGAEVAHVPGASGHSSMNGVEAETLFTFSTADAGEYTLAAPPMAPSSWAPWAHVIVTPAPATGGFIASVFGTIAGIFVTIGLALAGGILVIVGGIWWYTRAKARRQLQAGQWPAGSAATGYGAGFAGHGSVGRTQPGPPGAYPAPGHWHQQYGQQSGQNGPPGQDVSEQGQSGQNAYYQQQWPTQRGRPGSGPNQDE